MGDKPYWGVPRRAPSKSEQDYFHKNPKVSGMATSDNKVILNPFSSLSKKGKEADWFSKNYKKVWNKK